ncbi:hypothetical protein EYB25_009625 [Talaromyces marneffei]|nr:hypothetical protein EYB25_009625 [Talaromyces marneffei]
MRASLPLRSFSASCRGQVRPTLSKSPRTRNTQTAHSTRRWNSSNASSGTAFWTTSRALALAAVVGAGAYTAAAPRSTSSVTAAKDPTYGDITQFEKAIAELRAELGEDAISTDDDDLHEHGYSEWSTVNAERLPVAIAYPRSTEEVSKIAKVCHKYRMPMVPYSGGSSLEANFSAPYGGMTIDFAFMDKILEVHADDLDVVVQPSIPWMQLNSELAYTGLFFPVDPGPSAKIGGMVGTNCSGTNAVRYGTMKDWVINLTVVLADGRVIKTRRRPRKTSAGYNLTGMFVGSEGTLGIVTEITLKLAPIPDELRVGIVTFPTVRDAAAAAMQVIRKSIPVQAMEIMDEVQMNVINRAGGTGRTWREEPTLFFKFSGTTAQVADSIQNTKKIAQNNKSTSFEFAKDDQEAHALWSARKESLWSNLALRPEGGEVWSTDVAVPLSRLPDIIEKSKEQLNELNIFASILGHIGDGNFHSSILYSRKNREETERVEKVVHDMVDRAIEMDGSCTGEHGIGLGKKEYLIKELGPDTIDIMRSVKRALDPHWLMNPGKIFEYSRDSKPVDTTDIESARLVGAEKKKSN